MIDGIKFYFSANQFDGCFDNCVLTENKDKRTERKLYNSTNNAHISVWEHINVAVTIEESQRKWKYGDNSIADLTLPNFMETIRQIAGLLNISWEKFIKVKISQT